MLEEITKIKEMIRKLDSLYEFSFSTTKLKENLNKLER